MIHLLSGLRFNEHTNEVNCKRDSFDTSFQLPITYTDKDGKETQLKNTYCVDLKIKGITINNVSDKNNNYFVNIKYTNNLSQSGMSVLFIESNIESNLLKWKSSCYFFNRHSDCINALSNIPDNLKPTAKKTFNSMAVPYSKMAIGTIDTIEINSEEVIPLVQEIIQSIRNNYQSVSMNFKINSLKVKYKKYWAKLSLVLRMNTCSLTAHFSCGNPIPCSVFPQG